ncbi:Tubulin/FtsZ, GTPase domain-containing protein [Xylaria sp. FL0064]|nr:Tubulin/FtsZ, GTPase domain-containing protein [Xylaria sp. FL0064]
MREIINVQIGRSGNYIGTAFWENICREHGLNSDGIYKGTSDLQLEGMGVYFNSVSDNKYVPRAVLLGMDPIYLDAALASPFGRLFRKDNIVSGFDGLGGNGYIGCYAKQDNIADEALDVVLDAVRREAEGCDCIQGFQITHSLGGGTGSGTGALLLSRLREGLFHLADRYDLFPVIRNYHYVGSSISVIIVIEFPGRSMATFSIFPSPRTMRHVVESYNALLSVPKLVEHSDEISCIDNGALNDICQRTLELAHP